jgi:hypothetical protein
MSIHLYIRKNEMRKIRIFHLITKTIEKTFATTQVRPQMVIQV